MDKEQWLKKIINETKEAGTYRACFDSVIETLADILSRRDKAQELFDKSGGQILVKHTNKGGATNIEQNPALRLINDLNRDALSYWKEMGLTAAGLKRINDVALKPEQKESALEKALEKFGAKLG